MEFTSSSPSREQAETFLHALFAPYGETVDLFCEIRPLPAPGAQRSRSWHPLTSGGIQVASSASKKWSCSRNVYMGVLPRCLYGKGDISAIDRTSWVWADIDGGTDGVEAAKALLDRAWMPHPTIVVMSGGGLHVYWQLLETVVFEDVNQRLRFKELLERLVRAIGGNAPGVHADPACAEPARVLRVPGTLNHKPEYGAPRPVQLLTLDLEAEGFPLSWWRANLPAIRLSPPPKARQSSPDSSEKRMQALNRWAEQGYPEGNRHHDLTSAGAWLVRDVGLSKEVAEDLLLRKADASPGRRRITEEEVRRIIQWA